MLKINLPNSEEVVLKAVYDGCDSIRWLKHRGLLDFKVSITIDKTDVVQTIEAVQPKQSGWSLFGCVVFVLFFYLNSHTSRVSKRRDASQS